jgi:hypothetical protein
MELLTAPATVLLARVYQPVIVHHYRLYWISLDLIDPEHFVSANCPVILDLSGEPIVMAAEIPIGSVLRVHTVNGALILAVRPSSSSFRLSSGILSLLLWLRRSGEFTVIGGSSFPPEVARLCARCNM